MGCRHAHESFIGSAPIVVLSDQGDQGLLSELCEAMMDASICGLGQAAPNPILLTMKHFAEEV